MSSYAFNVASHIHFTGWNLMSTVNTIQSVPKFRLEKAAAMQMLPAFSVGHKDA